MNYIDELVNLTVSISVARGSKALTILAYDPLKIIKN
jgi:hypothetical protein